MDSTFDVDELPGNLVHDYRRLYVFEGDGLVNTTRPTERERPVGARKEDIGMVLAQNTFDGGNQILVGSDRLIKATGIKESVGCLDALVESLYLVLRHRPLLLHGFVSTVRWRCHARCFGRDSWMRGCVSGHQSSPPKPSGPNWTR